MFCFGQRDVEHADLERSRAQEPGRDLEIAATTGSGVFGIRGAIAETRFGNRGYNSEAGRFRLGQIKRHF